MARLIFHFVFALILAACKNTLHIP